MRQTRSWPLAAVILALLAVAMPAQAQTLVGALGAASVASSLQGIGSNAAAIGLGAANNAVNNLGGRRPAPAVPTVASGTASTRPAITGGTPTTARPAPATNNRPAPTTAPARPATQPATPARPATTPARPAPTPATPRPTGGITNNNANNNGGTNNGTNGNANNGNGGTTGTGNGAQTSGGRSAGYTANLTNNGYGRGVRGGTATASLGGRTLTPLRPVFNATAMGQTLRDARINIRMGFANVSPTAGANGNATARP